MKVTLIFLEPLLGTVPKDKEIYQTYIENLKPIEEGEEEAVNIDEIEEKGWTGFMRDENGLFIYNYMIKGFLKNAGNILKTDLEIKQLKSKINDHVFISPRKIYLGKTQPDGVLERSLRGMTPRGPRVSLVRSDYIAAGTKIEFEVQFVGKSEIKEETILALLNYGQYAGLGQFRGGGYGVFVFTAS